MIGNYGHIKKLKKTLNKLKDWIVIWIWFLFVLWIGNAWVDLWTVNPWDTMTDTIWNALVWKVNENGNKLDVITATWWNIGIWTATPSVKLEVNWNIISSEPTVSWHVATKNYVDGAIVSAWWTLNFKTWNWCCSCPYGSYTAWSNQYCYRKDSSLNLLSHWDTYSSSDDVCFWVVTRQYWFRSY